MLSNDSSVDSFFNNSDFNFENIEQKDEQPEETKKNTIEISLFTKRLCQGEKVAGIVKLVVNNTLPKGKVLIRMQTKLVSRRLKDLPLIKLETFLQDYKYKKNQRTQNEK